MYVYVYVCMLAVEHVLKMTDLYVCMCVYVYVCMLAVEHVLKMTNLYICMYVYIICIYVCMCVYVGSFPCAGYDGHVCMYACMYSCMYGSSACAGYDKTCMHIN